MDPAVPEDKRSATVLMIAAAQSQVEIVEYLVQSKGKAIVEQLDAVGWGAFALARLQLFVLNAQWQTH